MKKQFFTNAVMILLIICYKTLLMPECAYAQRGDGIHDRCWKLNGSVDNGIAQLKGQIPFVYSNWTPDMTQRAMYDEIIAQWKTYDLRDENGSPVVIDYAFIKKMINQGYIIYPTSSYVNGLWNTRTNSFDHETITLDGTTGIYVSKYGNNEYALFKVGTGTDVTNKPCLNPGRMVIEGLPPTVITNSVTRVDSVPYPVEAVVEKEVLVTEQVPVFVESMSGGCGGGGSISMNNGNVFAPTTIINDDHSIHVDSHDQITPPHHPDHPQPHVEDPPPSTGSGHNGPNSATGTLPGQGQNVGEIIPIKEVDPTIPVPIKGGTSPDVKGSGKLTKSDLASNSKNDSYIKEVNPRNNNQNQMASIEKIPAKKVNAQSDVRERDTRNNISSSREVQQQEQSSGNYYDRKNGTAGRMSQGQGQQNYSSGDRKNSSNTGNSFYDHGNDRNSNNGSRMESSPSRQNQNSGNAVRSIKNNSNASSVRQNQNTGGRRR